MILGHESITKELSYEEQRLTAIIIQGLKKYTKKNPIKEPEIIKSLNEKRETLGLTKKVTGVRLRKMVNYIRSKGMAPIMSTSKGYHMASSKEEIEDQIISMEQRANGILSAVNGLKKLL